MVKYINKLNLKILKYASLGRCFNHSNFNFGFNLKSFKMLKLNEKYLINNGQGSIVFTEGNKGTVNAVYTIRGNKSEGKINGVLDGNLLKGTFHVDAAAGLIEFTFNSNGFDAKWKQGLEPGPMRGKWAGSFENDDSKTNIESSQSSIFNFYIDRDSLSKQMRKLLTESDESKIQFCEDLVSFTKENNEYLWLIPAYLKELTSIEWLIDDSELEGSISGFFNQSTILDRFSTRVFNNNVMNYHARRNEFAWISDDQYNSLYYLLVEAMNISIDDLVFSYNAEYRSDDQILYIKFINFLRTVLFSTIVRSFNSEEYSNDEIANLIISPLEDSMYNEIESNTSGFGDGVNWAIEDVLFCLNIDFYDEEWNEEWNDYSINYEKIAETISDQESYDFPLIESY